MTGSISCEFQDRMLSFNQRKTRCKVCAMQALTAHVAVPWESCARDTRQCTWKYSSSARGKGTVISTAVSRVRGASVCMLLRAHGLDATDDAAHVRRSYTLLTPSRKRCHALRVHRVPIVLPHLSCAIALNAC